LGARLLPIGKGRAGNFGRLQRIGCKTVVVRICRSYLKAAAEESPDLRWHDA
jgi:hypothetical protein